MGSIAPAEWAGKPAVSQRDLFQTLETRKAFIDSARLIIVPPHQYRHFMALINEVAPPEGITHCEVVCLPGLNRAVSYFQAIDMSWQAIRNDE